MEISEALVGQPSAAKAADAPAISATAKGVRRLQNLEMSASGVLAFPASSAGSRMNEPRPGLPGPKVSFVSRLKWGTEPKAGMSNLPYAIFLVGVNYSPFGVPLLKRPSELLSIAESRTSGSRRSMLTLSSARIEARNPGVGQFDNRVPTALIPWRAATRELVELLLIQIRHHPAIHPRDNQLLDVVSMFRLDSLRARRAPALGHMKTLITCLPC